MPERTLNERITKLREWQQPVIPEGCRSDWWIRPDDGAVVPSSALPLYDSDPLAMAELLKLCFDTSIERYGLGWAVSCSTLERPEVYGHGKAETLEAAVAAAWYAAMKGKGGD